MFDRLAQLEKKDSHIRDEKPVVSKPQPTPVVKAHAAPVAKPIKETPKKPELKPAPVNRVVAKKENTQKVKATIKAKAVKPTASKKKPELKAKPKVTGKKIEVVKSKQTTPKRTLKPVSESQSESSEERASESEKSVEVHRVIHKSEPSSKKRSLDPRDAIPKFEKFHRKPRAHVADNEPVAAPEPKVRVQKPKSQKPAAPVVEKMIEEPVEEKRSPQKHHTTPAVIETPQQTTSKKPHFEKKAPKVVSSKKDDLGDDLLLSEMLASNSKNVQQPDNHGLNMLTGMLASPPPEEEHPVQEMDPALEMLMDITTPNKPQTSTKKAPQAKSGVKNESSNKASESKKKSFKADKSESKKKEPEPIEEEPIQADSSPERKESPANEPFSFIENTVDVDELNEMMNAKPASAKKSFTKSSANKNESKKSSAFKAEPAGLGILTGFGGDPQEEDEVVEEVVEEKQSSHEEVVEEEDEARIEEEDVSEERIEESISSEKASPVKSSNYLEVDQPSASLFGHPPNMFSHPTGSLFGLTEEPKDAFVPPREESPVRQNLHGGQPAYQDEHEQIENELEEGHKADGGRSESSMESRHKRSSASSSYEQKSHGDQPKHQSEEKDAHHGFHSREGGKLVLESLNQDNDTTPILLANQVRSFENENAHITLETSNLNRSRTDTPDKAFHDSSLDHQKQISNSKANDGTDFSFY
jgi:hypothetical protein